MARPMATAWRWPPERLRTGSRSFRRGALSAPGARGAPAGPPPGARAPRRAQLAAVDVDVERVGDGRRGLARGAAVDAGQEAERAADRLAAEEDVLADVEVIGERQVLVDGLDAALAGVAGACEGGPLALVPELAVVRLEDARDHLDEGGFAGPVVAGERQDLAAAQLEADLLERVDAAEALADLVAAQDGLGHQPSSARPPPARRAWDWSISTETMITMPTATNCQNGSTLMKTRPYWMTAMMRAPMTVPMIVPEPPNSEAPPITTAAIESSSSGSPAWAAPAEKRAV